MMTVEVRICQPFKTPTKQSVSAAAMTWAHGKRRGFSPAASEPLGLTFRSTHFFSCLHNVRQQEFLSKTKNKVFQKKCADKEFSSRTMFDQIHPHLFTLPRSSVLSRFLFVDLRVVQVKTPFGRSRAFQYGSTRTRSDTDAAHTRNAVGVMQMRQTRQM